MLACWEQARQHEPPKSIARAAHPSAAHSRGCPPPGPPPASPCRGHPAGATAPPWPPRWRRRPTERVPQQAGRGDAVGVLEVWRKPRSRAGRQQSMRSPTSPFCTPASLHPSPGRPTSLGCFWAVSRCRAVCSRSMCRVRWASRFSTSICAGTAEEERKKGRQRCGQVTCERSGLHQLPLRCSFSLGSSQ